MNKVQPTEAADARVAISEFLKSELQMQEKEDFMIKRIKKPGTDNFDQTKMLFQFESSVLADIAREGISKKNIPVIDLVDEKKKETCFYLRTRAINVAIPRKNEPKHASVAASKAQAQTPTYAQSESKGIKTPCDVFQKLGLGVRCKENGEVEFFNKAHEEMYLKLKDSRKITQKAAKEISKLALNEKGTMGLIEDFALLAFMLGKEEMDKKNTIHEREPDDLASKKNRTIPFHFKKELEAKNAYNLAKKIGFNPEWQARSSFMSFWLCERQKHSHKVKGVHPISNAVYEFGIPGLRTEDVNFYYINDVKKGIIYINGAANLEKRSEMAKKTFAYLVSKFSGEWEFNYKENSVRIRYEEKKDQTEKQTAKHVIEGDAFLKMFSEEQWQYLLTNAPREILMKVFPGEFGTKPETVNAEKQTLEKISAEFLLISKDHETVPGLLIAKILKKVEEI
jgi:hypothetical protein